MANEIVKYGNPLNSVPFRKFTSNEMDLFFAICSKMKNKGIDSVRFDFHQLKKLSNYKPTATARFSNDLENTYKKMLSLTYGKHENGRKEYFVLFTGFEIDENESYVDISVNPKLSPLLNELTNNFTRFELEEFTKLKSGYAKSMYRLLKQFRTTGFYLVSIEEFKRLLDVPLSYKTMSKIDEKILMPIEKELSNLFNDFVIKKIKKGRGQGGKVVQLQFTFNERKSVPLHNWLEE